MIRFRCCASRSTDFAASFRVVSDTRGSLTSWAPPKIVVIGVRSSWASTDPSAWWTVAGSSSSRKGRTATTIAGPRAAPVPSSRSSVVMTTRDPDCPLAPSAIRVPGSSSSSGIPSGCRNRAARSTTRSMGRPPNALSTPGVPAHREPSASKTKTASITRPPVCRLKLAVLMHARSGRPPSAAAPPTGAS